MRPIVRAAYLGEIPGDTFALETLARSIKSSAQRGRAHHSVGTVLGRARTPVRAVRLRKRRAEDCPPYLFAFVAAQATP